MPAPAWIWPAVAIGLLVLALLGLDSDGLLLIGGLAAAALTLLTALWRLPPLVALARFVLLAGAGSFALRRWDRRQKDRALIPSPRAERAEVISPLAAGGEGRVRWQGQSWAAINLDPSRSLPSGSEVTVMGRDGTRLQVLPH